MQKVGESVCDENAMEGLLAAGEEIDLLEGAEALVVEGDVDVDVLGEGKGVVGGLLGGRWPVDGRWMAL